jgi:hypothetical protein
MYDVLLAPAPREDLAEHLALFAPLIGSWSLEVDDIEPTGPSTPGTASGNSTGRSKAGPSSTCGSARRAPPGPRRASTGSGG